ncbi:hypothetical protein ACFBZI_07540 [Moraxella sp. ZJ142]|uniref:hypothetical protein n=1 Tax=Moraxella marmotae TaxID=3344520 RepID=UPI0035D405D6
MTKIKAEFIKTFIRGDKINSDSGYLTGQDYDPSRLAMFISHVKYCLEKNKHVLTSTADIFTVLAAIIAIVTFFIN